MIRFSYIERIAFEKGYRVSECGRFVTHRSKNCLLLTGRWGYLCISVRNEDHLKKNCYVHRLQAYQQFGDEIYRCGIEVRHLNGNHKDNSSQNIAIGTRSDNEMDKPPEVRRRARLIAIAANRKHDHVAIIAARKSGMTYSEIGDKFGIGSSLINFIITKSCTSKGVFVKTMTPSEMNL